MGVAACGQNFEDTFAELQDGDIERSAAEIVNRDDAVFAFLKPIGKGSRCGFVHDAKDVESGDAAPWIVGQALPRS
jgi:hypothetical protein